MIDPVGLIIAIIVAFLGYRYAGKKQKHRTLDGNTILKLEESGIDTSQPQMLEFWFFSNKQPAIENVAADLEQRGFQVYISDTEDKPRYVIRAIKELVPELSSLQKLRKDFNRLARSHGAEYDGWGFLATEPADE